MLEVTLQSNSTIFFSGKSPNKKSERIFHSYANHRRDPEGRCAISPDLLVQSYDNHHKITRKKLKPTKSDDFL